MASSIAVLEQAGCRVLELRSIPWSEQRSRWHRIHYWQPPVTVTAETSGGDESQSGGQSLRPHWPRLPRHHRLSRATSGLEDVRRLQRRRLWRSRPAPNGRQKGDLRGHRPLAPPTHPIATSATSVAAERHAWIWVTAEGHRRKSECRVRAKADCGWRSCRSRGPFICICILVI
jgi:hypothetical protein